MKKIMVSIIILASGNLLGMSPSGRAQSMLHAAARDGEYKMVARMLQEGIYDIDSQDSQTKRTPLMEALKTGQNTIAALLVHCKANLEVEDREGRTALSYAAANTQYRTYRAMVALLLKNGAKADHTDKLGKLPSSYDLNGNTLLYEDVNEFLKQDPMTKAELDALETN